MMNRIFSRMMKLAACGVGATVLAASCATDLRDAVAIGAMDYVTGATTELLGELINLSGAAAVD